MFEEFGNKRENEWWVLENGTKIHKTAIVKSWVRFENNCIVNAYAIVGREPDFNRALARQPKSSKILTIGMGSIIGCHTIVFSNVTLGDRCFIGDHALVREGTRIGNEVMIGCHVSVSYDSKIGNRNRFQNSSVFIGECGNDCFFGVGIVCSSDKKIDLDNYGYNDNSFTPPKFGNKVMIGSGANILPGVKIADGAIIAAGSVVTKDVLENEFIKGFAASVVKRVYTNEDYQV
jgi:acetyltransferase-like isoleucine patch superfamily enzyme